MCRLTVTSSIYRELCVTMNLQNFPSKIDIFSNERLSWQDTVTGLHRLNSKTDGFVLTRVFLFGHTLILLKYINIYLKLVFTL